MKKLALILFLMLVAFAQSAQDYDVFAGMRNTRFAFVGLESSHYGVAIENSVFIQKEERQYIRGALFYKNQLPLGIDIYYAFFGGVRYDGTYYDLGSRIGIHLPLLNDKIGIFGIIQPWYDSETGREWAYDTKARVRILKEIGLFGGLRTIPEFRAKEERIYAGISFESGNITVSPELSTPLEREMQLTRVAVSFIYKLPF